MTQPDDFHRRVRLVCARVEKALIALIVCALLAVAAVQALYLSDPVRRAMVPTERWEGQPVQP